MWEENGDGQRINRDNTHMNGKLKKTDREATSRPAPDRSQEDVCAKKTLHRFIDYHFYAYISF